MTAHPLRRKHRGLSLVEVLIAVGILAIVSLASVTAMLAAGRMSRSAVEDMMALEFVNRQAELMRSSRIYSRLGVNDFTGTQTFQYDPATFGATTAPVFTINYEWYGFGTVTGATGTSIRFDDSTWPSGVDFSGHRCLLRPTGLGTSAAIANITAHGNGSFTTDSAFNGWNQTDWEFAVPNGMYFEVDGGKWCRMTITWQTGTGRARTYTRTVFVPWRQDPTLN
jgi:prepilin-type N-terminal cleavage/methylation domain-containing protein